MSDRTHRLIWVLITIFLGLLVIWAVNRWYFVQTTFTRQEALWVDSNPHPEVGIKARIENRHFLTVSGTLLIDFPDGTDPGSHYEFARTRYSWNVCDLTIYYSINGVEQEPLRWTQCMSIKGIPFSPVNGVSQM